MIRIDADNAVIRIHRHQIRACSCRVLWVGCDSYNEVYNQLVADANALQSALNALTTARWTVEITD